MIARTLAALLAGVLVTAVALADKPPKAPEKSIPQPDPSAPPPRSTIFLCDASAQAKPKLGTIKREIKKIIAKLKPEQSFNVMIFRDGQVKSAFDEPTVPAGDANVGAANEFADGIDAKGKAGAIDAIDRVFRAKSQPDVCFLLFCGPDVGDGKKLVARVKELNAGGKVRVHVILMLARDELKVGTPAIDVVKQIAEDSGGWFKLADSDPVP